MSSRVGAEPGASVLTSLQLGNHSPRVRQATTSKHARKEPQDQQRLEGLRAAAGGVECCKGYESEKEDPSGN